MMPYPVLFRRPLRCAGLFLLLVCLAQALPHAAHAEQTESASSEWYEADALNRGLGTPPDGLDRSTPRSSLESFLIQANDGKWLAAAHMLDLSDVPEMEQRTKGPELARDFKTLLDRKIVIDWYALRDRPDGLDERAVGDAPMAGKPRRSILLWYVDLGNRPVPIRINRIKPKNGEAVWVVSRQTVDNLPALGQAYAPSALEKALPSVLRREAVWGLQWWEAIGLPLAIAITALAGWITQKLLSRGLHRNRRVAPASFLVAMRGPVVLLVMTVTLAMISNRLFIFSGRIDTVISPLVVLGVVAAVLWLIVNIADVIIERLVSFDGAELSAIGEGQELRRAMATRVSALRRGAIVLIAMVGVGIVLNEASVMQSLGISLLASAGTIGILLAFAARNILSNIMASLQISMNQSARIGDKILFRDYVCSVERINFTYVQLRVWTGKRLVVPVVDFVAEPFENWTMQEHFTLFEVILRLDHLTDVAPLRLAYHRLLDDYGLSDAPDSRGVYVTQHDIWGQTVLFLVPSDDPNTGWATSCDLREALLAEARKLDGAATPVFPRIAPPPETGAALGS
ncbi:MULTISPECIES: mechanosensitive ion channel domain-containing protein [Thioclava]|uniref:Mechanosensitive ion channel n=1 Tax=Thioclava litoralis TaxID=3076557 RepID=A0ABZ1E6F8_9RHOB|nr:mechanosensitive ion channel [Thioclava sp. FTW29]